MDMLPITTTAKNVRSGIAAAMKDTPYTCLLYTSDAADE